MTSPPSSLSLSQRRVLVKEIENTERVFGVWGYAALFLLNCQFCPLAFYASSHNYFGPSFIMLTLCLIIIR